jgi:diacylglycerol kinase family enzyme
MLARDMSGVLIVNPFASAVDDERVAAVQREVRPSETVLTERRSHATEIAREVREGPVWVFGGDGTFNEVLNGIASDVPVGLLPGGGSSVLPRALGLPEDPVRAARALAGADERRITLGCVNGRRFAFSAGMGLDAELVRRVDRLGRSATGKRPGDLKFALTAVRMLAERRFGWEPELEIAGLGRAAFALVANGDPYTYAGRLGLRVAPDARFDLGLDVVAPRRLRARMLPRIAAYVLVTHGQTRSRDILYAHDQDRIDIRGDRPVPLQADGEDLGDVTEAVFEAERGAAIVLVPAASQ